METDDKIETSLKFLQMSAYFSGQVEIEVFPGQKTTTVPQDMTSRKSSVSRELLQVVPAKQKKEDQNRFLKHPNYVWAKANDF